MADPVVRSASMRIRTARAIAWLLRIHRLGILDRAFRDIPKPYLLKRPAFGHQLVVDVSRGEAQQRLYMDGERFVQERFLLRQLLRRGMTVVDVGANIGYYLLLFEQSVGPNGHVVCIEPSPENLDELAMNVRINAFANADIQPVALGGEEGVTGLRSGINSGVTAETSAAYQVPLRTLDSVLTTKADFIKIDVEGYEAAVLAGALRTIRRDRPALFVEIHPYALPRFGSSADEVMAFLRAEYASVRCYAAAGDAAVGGVGRVMKRYALRPTIVSVDDVVSERSRNSAAEMPQTFWAVCQAAT